MSYFKKSLVILSIAGLGIFAACKTGRTTKSSSKQIVDNSPGEPPTGIEPGFNIIGPPIAGVGPLDPYHGFPMWYQDSNGVKLELCHNGDAKCVAPPPSFNPALPPRFPENFPNESFYWMADNALTISTGGTLRVEFAIEAAFLSADPMPGRRIVFGRTRFIGKGLRAGTYRITHPYGIDEFYVTAGVIKSTNDVGVGVENFNGVLKSPFGTFLSWDTGASAGYIGDSAVAHPFIGSPFGTNFYRVEFLQGNNVTIVAQSNTAFISGRLAPDGAYVSHPSKTYTSAPTVTMTASTPGSKVFYTTDGSDPISSGSRSEYSSPVALAGASPIVLKTVPETNGTAGVVKTYTYTLNPAMLSASASPASGTYTSQQTVTLTSEGGATAIFYTFDGSDPITSPTKGIYQSPIAVPNNGTTAIRYVAVKLSDAGAVLAKSEVNIAYYSIGAEKLTRSEIDPQIEMPFSAADTNRLSLTTCWQASDPMCLPPGPEVDLTQAVVFPRNFATESFMFNAGAKLTVAGAGTALLVLAVEGAYLSPKVDPGNRLLFGRIRIRADINDAGQYRVTHPYGVNYFDVTTTGLRAINYTDDVTPEAGNFDLFRFGRIGPFVTWDPAIAPQAPVGYIGDPAIPHAVTGSPFNTNYFKIERQQPDGTYVLYNYFTDQFTVSGKKAKALSVSAAPAGAFYSSPRSVDLTASDANAKIYYTTDGTDPKTNPEKNLYDTSISIPTTTLLKFYAELPDGTQSDIVSEPYSVDVTPFSVTATPAGSPVVDTVQVTLARTPSTRAGTIFYTRDGSSPLSSATKLVYTAPITITSVTQVTLKSFMLDLSGLASPERTDVYTFSQSKPVVTPPVSNFVVNSRLTGTAVPVITSWTSAAFAGRTIASHTATVAINALNAAVTLNPVTRTNVTQTLGSGASYRYSVTARDSGRNVSAASAGTLFNLFAAQETTRGFGFPGGWTRITAATFSGGRAMSTTRAGINATLTVTGSKFGWVSARGPTLGIATVSVDGGAPVTVDLYSATSLPASVVYVTPALAAGTHVIRVTPTGTRNARSTGNRVDVDAIVGM